MGSFSFYLPGSVLISLSFLRGHFAGCRLLVGQFFFQHFKSHPLHLVTVSNSKLGVNSLLASCKILSLSLDNLPGTCFRVWFFEFILLGDHWASWTCRFARFLKSGEFLAIISSNNFFCSFLFSLPGTPVKCMLVHDAVPQVSGVLFIYLHFFPHLLNWLIFTFTNSSASSNVLLSPFSEIFISVFIHFNKIIFGTFLKM